MDPLALSLLLVGLLTLSIGLASVPIERSCVSPPLIALLLGVAVGPHVFGLVDTQRWSVDDQALMHQVSRGTLAIGLMGVALRLPARMVLRRWRTLLVLILVAMPTAMLITAAGGYVLLGLPWMTALVLGAIACPTDPVVASSIVTGPVARKNLSKRLRRIISAESGLNDGLAFPLVFLPLLLMQHATGQALREWTVRVILWETAGAILLGAAIGWSAGRLLCWCESRHTIETRSLLGFTLALTCVSLGAAKLLHTDDVLAVFIAGLAFDAGVSRHDRLREERIQETVNQFFSIPIFALLGVMLPLQQWWQMGGPALAYLAVVLLLRRLPVVLALGQLMPSMPRRVDRIYAGWFGPIGVAALFYSTTAMIESGESRIWDVTTLLIAGSVLAHGMTATPLTKRYAAYRHKQVAASEAVERESVNR